MPYAVFEVKMAGTSMPETISALEEKGIIVESAKFSKYITGAACYHTRKVSMLPSWAEHPSFAPLFQTRSYVATKDSGEKNNIWATASASSSTHSQLKLRSTKLRGMFSPPTLDSYKKIAPKTPARVEPKSYFANERTFVQWISAALFLTTIAALLLNFDTKNGNELTSGLALIWLAGCIVIYSLFVYCRRLKLLRTGQTYGYVDRVGPSLLAGAVIAGLTVLGVHFHKLNRVPRSPPLLTVQGDVCYQHSLKGFSLLEYQPSDVVVDQMRQLLLVPSLNRITGISLPRSIGKGATVLVELENSDFEGLAVVNGTVFAISEGTKRSEIIALQWSILGKLDEVNRWNIPSVNAEGITYVPNEIRGRGQLYVSGDWKLGPPELRGYIDVYDIPLLDDTSAELSVVSRLNSNMLSSSLIDSKISSLHYFERVLYVLHDNAQVVQAWNIEEGVKLSEWHLPIVGSGSKQWEGIAVEREEPRDVFVRGAGKLGDLILHLTLDSPPEVWSFRVNEGDTSGQIVLPDCAAAW
jgi:uncharacterized membrane protein YidH (DUF202 family)